MSYAQSRLGLCFRARAALWCVAIAVLAPPSRAQDKERYILGAERKLEIVVHIWGEVVKPGEYQVADNTDVVELVSKAGGPTEFADLSGVTVTHANDVLATQPGMKRVEMVNVTSYLRKTAAPVPLRLSPGDVVVVHSNAWSRYKRFASVGRDIAVVLSAYFLYLRVR